MKLLCKSEPELFITGEYITNGISHWNVPHRYTRLPVRQTETGSEPDNGEVLPGVRVLCQGSQAAGVHVSSYIDVHGSVRLGELSREGDALRSQRRNRGPCQRQTGHASSLLRRGGKTEQFLLNAAVCYLSFQRDHRSNQIIFASAWSHIQLTNYCHHCN